MRRFFGVILALAAVSLQAQTELTRTPPPSWVETSAWTPPASSKTGADYEDYVRDYQVNLVTHEQYVRFAFRFLTQKGVQNDSTARIDYAPDYQTVRLHTLRLWRNGKSIDQKSIPFRDVQRESGLEESMYDGERTWVGFLKDVRPGDVLEMAYSIQGDNPIFGGRYADVYHLETSYPVDRWSLRILSPRGQSPQIRAMNTTVKPTTAAWNDLDETTMEAVKVAATENDSLAPSDIDARARYVLSDWKSWGEVADWALPLYTPSVSPEVSERAAELIHGQKSPDERLVALLEFVQDKIRYLGIEVGVNSHQPRPAEEVLGNGFGDCKDKVMLFCTMAASAGLKAWPVLVHTSNGSLVKDEGPTPLAFNHVIAAVASSRGTVYVDPTADQQGGPLATRVLGAFAYGLEIKPGVQSLTVMPQATPGRRELIQTYKFPSFQDEATVSMDYTFSGADADTQRRRWDGLSVADWRKDTNEWLKDRYTDATIIGDPVTSDDRAANVFRLSYSFTLRGYWEQSTDGWKAPFYPSLVGANLYDPDHTGQRTLPYAIEYPETVRQVRRVEVPEDWSIEATDQTLDGPGFKLQASARQVTPRLIEMVDEYESLSDRVDPKDWNEYLQSLRTARDNLYWTLSWHPDHNDPKTDQTAESGTDIMKIGSVAVGVMFLLLIAAFQGADF